MRPMIKDAREDAITKNQKVPLYSYRTVENSPHSVNEEISLLELVVEFGEINNIIER